MYREAATSIHSRKHTGVSSMSIYISSLDEARQYRFVPESYEWPDDAELRGWGGNHGIYTSGPDHHNYGKPLSEEHKEKIRKVKRGKPQPIVLAKVILTGMVFKKWQLQRSVKKL